MPVETSTESDPSGHVVQFYEDAGFLAAWVSRFLAEGLQAGEAILVVASEEHRNAVEIHLRSRMAELDLAAVEGRYLSLDAGETLARFMAGREADADLFESVLGTAVANGVAAAPSRRVRAFGEMVALLCDGGNAAGAISLERLWNRLASAQPLSLFCAYPMALFQGEAQAAPFGAICAEHSSVIPSETFAALDAPAQRRAIALLQQKASSLDVEVDHRRKAEKTLSRREKELTELLEGAAEGIHRVGRDGRILWANKAELDLLGYSADEYVGRKISDFHVDATAVETILRRLLRRETLYDEPARLRCKDGSIKHVRIHTNALWEDGRFLYTHCFTRDVSDRVALEDALRQKLAQLAEADRHKDEFLAMLGHELRNPLSPIVTAVQMMRMREDDRDVSTRSLDVIERQTKHLSRLVDDLLDVSRITHGTISLREETVSLAGIVEAAVEQARRSMEERGHQFTLRLPPDPITLWADPARLEQVLVNLLGNAAKYTPMGGRISVDVRVNRGEVEIAVRDNGIGLPPEARDGIFELFVRSPDSRTNDPGGLGVGLTLARRIVELHGGCLEARSEGRGRGSSFVVRLPARSSLSLSPDSRRVRADASPAEGLRRRILVVDDNVDAAEGLSDFLRAHGHSVRTVHEGASAIEVAAIVRPEIVLLDIGLPDIDGYEVARRLREDGHLRRSLLIALTGYGQPRDRERSREAGFDHHLVKPVDLARLESLLELPS
ncbi:MAG: MEDS domain-containing protein [Acidobacteria bacterium]|nr:MEDS domain-containing protein [Acidobacteriota bacterium]MCA1609987.1 MEDS domain-containing protein [Acidobacteriota bacterium]